ncbi:MAG: tripartite tricarboxylate transporter substrate binding protein [Burkholderiales bacterium]|nr:tripartite tricarboxylate transporter substrate binding protein [Burkholderiales bacterium]
MKNAFEYKRLALAMGITALILCGNAGAQWKPERPVELITSVSPGGNTDITARTIQKIWQDRKMITTPVLVLNKPGGGGAIAATYLAQHTRDPHHLLMITPGLLTNHILGAGKAHHNDFTPVTMLLNESIFISVRSDSPIRTGRDLISRLVKTPDALSAGIASALGNQIHMGIALPMKAAGVDIRRMKIVTFKSSGESITALLGGHIDITASTAAALLPHVNAGRLRIIGMSASQRLPGPLAEIPTWKEQGANATFETWRGMLGPKDISEEQLKFWESAFFQMSRSKEWKDDVEKNYRVDSHMSPSATRNYLDRQYAELEETLTTLGLSKRARESTGK